VEYTCDKIFEKCKNNFEGYFKLTKDPIHEKITSENIVSHGSVLKSGFMIGIILYSGNKSLCSVDRGWRLGKYNQLEVSVAKFTLPLVIGYFI
jgi:hypothetical protein